MHNIAAGPPFAVSQSGTLVYARGASSTETPPRRLVLLDREGIKTVLAKADLYQRPRLSPRGDPLAYDLDGDIWIVDLVGGAPRRLMTGPEAEYGPTWSRQELATLLQDDAAARARSLELPNLSHCGKLGGTACSRSTVRGSSARWLSPARIASASTRPRSPASGLATVAGVHAAAAAPTSTSTSPGSAKISLERLRFFGNLATPE